MQNSKPTYISTLSNFRANNICLIFINQVSRIHLVDLAGSERLSRSGAGSNARQLRETQAINKSLSCLGDVFTALSNGTKHVPFRNSKLTYLLQDCLSGDGKALMFVNLSPTEESSSESLCSLRFAQRVNQIELGKATKHIDYSSKQDIHNCTINQLKFQFNCYSMVSSLLGINMFTPY